MGFNRQLMAISMIAMGVDAGTGHDAPRRPASMGMGVPSVAPSQGQRGSTESNSLAALQAERLAKYGVGPGGSSNKSGFGAHQGFFNDNGNNKKHKDEPKCVLCSRWSNSREFVC